MCKYTAKKICYRIEDSLYYSYKLTKIFSSRKSGEGGAKISRLPSVCLGFVSLEKGHGKAK